MIGSVIVYAGIVLACAGLVLTMRPVRRLGVGSRRRALAVAATGVVVACVGLILPAPESRIARVATRLDEYAPAWQFHEFHSIRIAAPPARVFEAIERVRADEIFLFRMLTWIRRGGKPLPPGVLNAGGDEPLIEVAIQGGFLELAREPPREVVIGTFVVAPPGPREPPIPQTFRRDLPGGYAKAVMNFVVTPDGAGGSRVTTETRVFASSPSVRRKFAAYWRLIYPGSALIRRMWLRAIARRATDPSAA